MVYSYISKFLNNKKLPLLIIVLFFILRLKYFTTDIYFPDEIHHTLLMSKIGNFINETLSLNSYLLSENLLAIKEIMSENLVPNNIYAGEFLNQNFSNIFSKVFGKISNYEGFGAIYWIIGGIVSAVTKDFRLVLRILSLLSICLSAFYFYSSLKTDNIIRSFSTLLFLSTPFLWYGGKLITPEFYILPIIFFAYYKYFQDTSYKINSLLFGLAVGIKSSISPALFPYFIDFLKNKKFYLLNKKIIIFFLLFTIGLIIASPNIIWDPFGYFNSIPKNFEISTLSNLKEISFKAIKLWNQGFIIQREWDLVVGSGYFKVIFSFLNLIILTLISLLIRQLSIFIKLSLTLTLFFILMLFQGNYIWHYFSLIPIAFFYITKLINISYSDKRIKCLKKYLIPLIILSIMINISNINLFTKQDNKIRYETFSDIKNYQASNTECIIKYFDSRDEKDFVIIDGTGMLKTSNGKQILNTQKIEDEIQQTYFSFIDPSSFLKTFNGNEFRESEKIFMNENNRLFTDKNLNKRKNFYFLFYKPYKQIINNGKNMQERFLEKYVRPKIIFKEAVETNSCRNITIFELI